MTTKPLNSITDPLTKTRNVVFVLLGTGVFILKRRYTGPLQEVVQSYVGNLSVSFALYYVFVNVPLFSSSKRIFAAILALAAVELFEAFNGFGIMANVYDPIDFAANAMGVALALAVDIVLGLNRTRHAVHDSA